MSNDDTALKSDWIKGVTVHTGSKKGRGSEFMDNAREMGRLLPENGFKTLYYGDGVAGTMGAFSHSAVENGASVQGVTLAFFLSAQGGPAKGCKPTISVETMAARMQCMRENTDIAIALPGSMGTLEETFEWVTSRNKIVKPQIIVSYNGYYDGLKEFLSHCAQSGYRDPGDVKRIHIVPTPQAAINKIFELNARPPVPERTATLQSARWQDYVEETRHALIVKPAPLNIMAQLFTRFVTYDISSVKGQTVFKDDIIKPAIFVNEGGVFNGLQKQVRTILDAEFIAPCRRAVIYFAEDDSVAHKTAAYMDRGKPLLPQDLDKKPEHIEATSRIPDKICSNVPGLSAA